MNVDIIKITLADVKEKMSDIRRGCIDKIINNYYCNYDKSDELSGVIGERTIVFWHDDNEVTRVYFNSCDPGELTKLLSLAPRGSVIDYITKNDSEHAEIFAKSGYEIRYNMVRMSNYDVGEKKRAILEEFETKKQQLGTSGYARAAEEKDLDLVFAKLYEVFSRDESHLPSRDMLLQLIRSKCVTVYFEDDVFKAFRIFQIQGKRVYAYQMWNSAGPKGRYPLMLKTEQMQADALHEAGIKQPICEYSWVNVKNQPAMRAALRIGKEFDGLYDNVYVKR